MSRPLFVHFLPVLFEPAELRGGVAVILDILRASTTIVHALDAGAERVIPVAEVEEALDVWGGLPPEKTLRGGEREGIFIPGFELDNNPFAYTPEVVRGKTIVFTTTNGTRALQRSLEAEKIVIGSFVNLRATVAALAADTRPVHLVCAGTKGKVTLEDTLCAGAIAAGLLDETGETGWQTDDDQLQLALDFYHRHCQDDAALLEVIRKGYGGRNCRRLGLDDQIARVANRDLFDRVPQYSFATRDIR